ncbi:Ldh family oxidoreductase [Antarctobacter heliothermus]|uniref:Malate/lactate/ureidoglycolate dehydrogenase, LDH2 family n=1 Tax=Antarctobacter heliothermus TaxID=74033 RepID=A0A239KER9_9RHOB|nr:Ldh family oxidoreductase [Antarctobacter heliothermus]SNT16490.1 Malate/lactate/ureidoglycolate dehydrogenase, LDH2 family [Antarctobacter heliothermus]
MTRVPVETLLRFASAQLGDAGLSVAHARIVAETLVEGDLLGHATHGTALLPRYLAEIASGDMARDGQPQITRTAGSVAEHWDGRWLPGPVLVRKAIDSASHTARRQGLGAVAIAKSHHIACLAAYLEAVTQQDLAVIIASSSPSNRQVAPYGAVGGVYSPNPIAAGWPTRTQPVMLDISMSIATSGLVSAMAAQGRDLPGEWLVNQAGRASSDPATLEAGGALLPAGGLDHGHKGFGLGLLVEMLTTGLAGHGRVEQTDRWGASVFVLILDPAHFGGLRPFSAQASWLADACRAAPVPDGAPAVRLPGERGLKRKQEQLRHGIDLAPDLHATLQALGLQTEENPQ